MDNRTRSDGIYFVAVCGTCDELLVYAWVVDLHAGGEPPFEEAGLMWPDDGTLHHSVPDAIRDCYREAFGIRRIAPTAFAVQVGRALEFLCRDRKANGGTLQERLNTLAQRGEIPGALATMTAAIRILRNIGAHAEDVSVSEVDADAIDGFFRSLVEYVYVAPYKLGEYEKRLREIGTKPVGAKRQSDKPGRAAKAK